MRKRFFLVMLLSVITLSAWGISRRAMSLKSLPQDIDHSPSPTLYLRFSEDGQRLIKVTGLTVGSFDIAERSWTTGDLKYSPLPVQKPAYIVPNAYAFTGDGKNALLAANVGTLLVQDHQAQLVKAWPQAVGQADGMAYAAAISPDRKLIAGGHELCVWQTKTAHGPLQAKQRLWLSPGVLNPPAVLRFSPRSELLASGYYTGEVVMRDARSGKLIWRAKAPKPFPAKGLSYFPTDPMGNPVNLTAYGNPLAEKIYFPMCFISDEFLAYGNGRATFICQARTGKIVYTIPRSRVYDLQASTDGKILLLAGISPSAGPCIELWDGLTGQLQSVLPGSSRTFQVAVSPDGKYIAGAEESHVKLWEIR